MTSNGRKSLRSSLRYLPLVWLLFGAVGYAQNDLTGYWDLQLPSPDGNVRHTYFQLSVSGATVTGTLFGRSPQGTPLSGTYTAGHLHFATVPPSAVPGSPTGRVDGRSHGV